MNAVLDDHRTLYEILRNHDARYDGRIFVGVSSTGIYCRPVCRARIPKRENCTFFAHAAVAEKAGYRPCLLCRPELAPGTTKADAVSNLANLALRRIEDGALNALSVEQLAGEFGVTSRHLRRALTSEFGVTPIELAQTQRLLLAKQLLTESDLSITEVAFAAGFESLRRFNALFKTRYRLAPSALRRESRQASVADNLDAQALSSFRIEYRPPFNFEALLRFLQGRAISGVECVSNDSYQRTVRIGDHQGWIRVQQTRIKKSKRPRHELTLFVSEGLRPVVVTIIAKVKALFDTRADIDTIEKALRFDDTLVPFIEARPGLRVPGAFDGFELLVRAILGQQVSVKGATTLSGRLAERFGEPIDTENHALRYLSPTAAVLARATVEDISAIGLPKKRAQSIHAAARAVAFEHLMLAPGTDPVRARDQLVDLPGIGDWTAAYVQMRALAWPDAMPAGDLGIKKALGVEREKAVAERTESWRPWRAYGAMHLWHSLAQPSGG